MAIAKKKYEDTMTTFQCDRTMSENLGKEFKFRHNKKKYNF